ncbi:uncharacterized protein MONOS_12836 [Monocercomonoides exilis]|uniref:uncharacterized protein n=1 Tax=Monocercomonoides exilis TaxID=2049356 RepID=UPI003559F372|nr:hypothetical protein MONOS_12836 [Monocercomonoides exilis]|eukprot:MONOS_12836.1-p1 / transcript=MONOS_12836.1 / gene=MONOS_12836 / organism=Monocercomonoides_exilis_PA203 / gene_product=unspecified product / transcript_product=unspecified product / location=Mono_scaffold00740:22671-22928(+) / protein_length=86 / sequence_SO=supercontig / SO=protein_coding / is_pseudo=false
MRQMQMSNQKRGNSELDTTNYLSIAARAPSFCDVCLHRVRFITETFVLPPKALFMLLPITPPTFRSLLSTLHISHSAAKGLLGAV